MNDIRIVYAFGEDKRFTPGPGTDVFIRKNVPGSHIGEGYTIEIFNNAVKVDEKVVKNKKQVQEIIDDIKTNYSTSRAFQNELQLHVTYKTKKERGEEASMNVDTQLTKQGSKIRQLVSKLLDPESPIKKFSEELHTNFLQTPSLDSSNISADNQIIVQKMVEMVDQKVQESADIEQDYNEIKEWLAEIKNIIKEHNRAGADFDLDEIADEFSKIVLDPNHPAHAVFSKKATFMDRQETQSNCGLTEDEKKLDQLISLVTRQKDTPQVSTKVENNIEPSDKKDIKELLAISPKKTDSEHILENILIQAQQYDNFIRKHAKNYWGFVSQYKGISTLEDTFNLWVHNKPFGLRDASFIWKQVLEDVDYAFNQEPNNIYREAARKVFLPFRYGFSKEAGYSDDPEAIKEVKTDILVLLKEKVGIFIKNIINKYSEEYPESLPESRQEGLINQLSDKFIAPYKDNFDKTHQKYAQNLVNTLIENLVSNNVDPECTTQEIVDTVYSNLMHSPGREEYVKVFNNELRPILSSINDESNKYASVFINKLGILIQKAFMDSFDTFISSQWQEFIKEDLESKRHIIEEKLIQKKQELQSQQETEGGEIIESSITKNTLKNKISNKIEVKPDGSISIETSGNVTENPFLETSVTEEGSVDIVDEPLGDTEEPIEEEPIEEEPFDVDELLGGTFEEDEVSEDVGEKETTSREKRTLVDILRD